MTTRAQHTTELKPDKYVQQKWVTELVERTTAPDFRVNARNYVDEQLAVLGKSARVLSQDEYSELVDEVEAVGRKLWRDSGGEK